MGKTTIEWTATQAPDGTWHQGYSFNPWVGCTKVSPACDNCYAEAWAKRTGQSHLWAGERRRTTEANWREPLRWDRNAETSGERPRVFCASLADVFDNQVPEQWRSDLFALIEDTPNLDWLLLTKRPQNIAKMVQRDCTMGTLPANVWLGTTVENQEEADRRIPYLRKIDVSVRFLSCEPLLESIRPDLADIQWVICGGESGGGARAMADTWARSLRNQCASASVPFFMKQMSGTSKARMPPIPEDLMVREFPA